MIKAFGARLCIADIVLLKRLFSGIALLVKVFNMGFKRQTKSLKVKGCFSLKEAPNMTILNFLPTLRVTIEYQTVLNNIADNFRESKLNSFFLVDFGNGRTSLS